MVDGASMGCRSLVKEPPSSALLRERERRARHHAASSHRRHHRPSPLLLLLPRSAARSSSSSHEPSERTGFVAVETKNNPSCLQSLSTQVGQQSEHQGASEREKDSCLNSPPAAPHRRPPHRRTKRERSDSSCWLAPPSLAHSKAEPNRSVSIQVWCGEPQCLSPVGRSHRCTSPSTAALSDALRGVLVGWEAGVDLSFLHHATVSRAQNTKLTAHKSSEQAVHCRAGPPQTAGWRRGSVLHSSDWPQRPTKRHMRRGVHSARPPTRA